MITGRHIPHLLRLTLCASLALALAPHAFAQQFVSINLPDNLCAGSQHTLTFGFRPVSNVRIFQPTTTLQQAGQVFLPDGQPCGTLGCSYRSTVTFTDFLQNSTITSAQDIKYVRLNIEHSYIGDIYIGITCPNGNKATIMPWRGSGSSDCTSAVPTNARSWNTSSSNMSSGTFLGAAYDYTGYPACSSTASGNEPGVGWNYCWSSNTTSGYSYASGDGLIYRSTHAHSGRVDSSNVAAHANFYKPEQNFNALVGCPLNGQWYIEVIDAFSGDNGYIFGWELALDPALVPQECNLTYRDIIGDHVTRINDSVYRLIVPEIQNDSSLALTLRMLNNCGDTIDSVVNIAIHPNVDTSLYDTVCDSYAWNNGYVTESSVLTNNLYTRYQCDSVVTIDLTVLHSTADTLMDTVVENSLPYYICQTWVSHSVTDTVFLYTNAVGCDSAFHFSLHVWPNVDSTFDSNICAHQLPFTWERLVFDSAGIQYDTLLDVHGADSVLVLRLGVKPDDTVYIVDTVVENSLPYSIADTAVGKAYSDTTFMLVNRNGCDSLIHLALHVWPNVDTTLDTAVCRHQLPITWMGIAIADADTVSVLVTDSHGADSTVYMRVAVLDDDTVYRNDTIVENSLPYSIQGGFTFTDDSDTTLFLTNNIGCDSTVHYTLKVWRNVEANYDTTVCDNVWPLEWRGYNFLAGGHATTFGHNVHGADSTTSLQVTVNAVYDTTLTPEICDDNTYTLGPRPLNATGHYEHTFASIDGCDSLVRVDLTVWPTYKVDHFDTACFSDGFEIGGIRHHESGIMPHMYTTTQNCDSLVTHYLHIKGRYLKARAHISPEIVTLGNLDVQLNDMSRASSGRLWLVGDDVTSHQEKLSYTYPEDRDTVPLYLIAYSDDGCTDTLHTLLQIDRTVVYVPNAFTPTLETNNKWFIYTQDITDIEVWIYNRQGNLVFHYTGPDGQWDGNTHSGIPCPQGSYVFKADYTSRVYPERPQSITGTILLIR